MHDCRAESLETRCNLCSKWEIYFVAVNILLKKRFLLNVTYKGENPFQTGVMIHCVSRDWISKVLCGIPSHLHIHRCVKAIKHQHLQASTFITSPRCYTGRDLIKLSVKNCWMEPSAQRQMNVCLIECKLFRQSNPT